MTVLYVVEVGLGDYRTLDAWKKAHHLVLSIYQATGSFPREEIYGLTSQLRRAGASIPANLAEGCGRNSDAEIAHFATIALGSANELEYHLLLAHDLGMLDKSSYAHLGSEIGELKRMLFSLVQVLQSKSARRVPAKSTNK